MHDGRIVHGAKANTSPIRRTGYTMRYFPTSVKMFDNEINEGWKIWLARGEDLAGNTYANVPAPCDEARLPHGLPARHAARRDRRLGGRAAATSASRSRSGRDVAGPRLGGQSPRRRGVRTPTPRRRPGSCSTSTGWSISALAYYENNLRRRPRPRERRSTSTCGTCIDAAQLLGCGLVGTFVGRDVTLTVHENLRLAETGAAAAGGLRRRPRRAAGGRELPDGGLAPRRLPGQPRLLAAALGLDGRTRPLPELRPVAPGLAGDRSRGRAARRTPSGSCTSRPRTSRSTPPGRNRVGVFGNAVDRADNPWESGWWRYRIPGLGEVDWRGARRPRCTSRGLRRLRLGRARGPGLERVARQGPAGPGPRPRDAQPPDRRLTSATLASGR